MYYWQVLEVKRPCSSLVDSGCSRTLKVFFGVLFWSSVAYSWDMISLWDLKWRIADIYCGVFLRYTLASFWHLLWRIYEIYCGVFLMSNMTYFLALLWCISEIYCGIFLRSTVAYYWDILSRISVIYCCVFLTFTVAYFWGIRWRIVDGLRYVWRSCVEHMLWKLNENDAYIYFFLNQNYSRLYLLNGRYKNLI